MKIDSRNFPPIAILGREGERFSVSMPDVMMKNGFEPKGFYKMLDGLVEGARPNVITYTKEADNLMTMYNKDCIESYLADSNKKTFAGAYLDMSMPVSSMDLFHIMPLRRTNDRTGAIEDVIACLLMSIQSKDNIVVSYGAITYKNYRKGRFETEPALNCFNNEVRDRSIDYMMYLLELNCFLEYAPEDAMNVIMVFGNQKVSLPGLGGFENRTHLIIKCLCSPQTNK